MVPPQLKGRVDDFLSTLRLGIDFGETAGGIGLVYKNTVIHAETFVDFHDATLETRRALRRGRRARNSKRMRLARLRSWALRQTLPNGNRLPDPYHIMHDLKFQTSPGLFNKEGGLVSGYRTWIEAAKNGKVDSDGFVCALTHLFQKRGYKYDNAELADFSNTKLLDLMNSCCLLESAPELAKGLEAEIEKRGRPNKLYEAYQMALTRNPEPRKAVPRQLKENDLKEMVERFGKQNGLTTEEIRRWNKELKGLLNKVLREARFDNRLRSVCAWCGKNTPRVKKQEVRYLAYLAAIRNLRVKTEVYGKTRPINEVDLNRFILLWKHRQMADYTFPRGRKVDVFDRTPTRENLEKIFERLNFAKSWFHDSKGKSELGYGMLNQIDNLLNHVPENGRAKLCMEHLKMAANGKNMKDAGIEWQTMRVRRAPNPRREQHDARVIKRVEHILFIKGKRGDDAWRWRDGEGKPLRLGFITLEVPEPDTERGEEGRMTQLRDGTISSSLLEETGGVCIYQYTKECHERNGALTLEAMEKDHIVPKKVGGPDMRINRVACCRECNNPNTGKGGRLPSDWIPYGSAAWKEFEARVNNTKSMPKLPEAKRALLLLPPGSSFPDDPTPLAQVGARPRAFIAELIRMFEGYGVQPPTMDYNAGVTHVQRVSGKWTTMLRQAWLWKDKDTKIQNFPEKYRSDLFNHAQDAVLIAATPPHTWKEQILYDEAIRWCLKRDQDKHVVFKDGKIVRELRERGGLPLLDLAPDWAGFMAIRNKPIVIPLGKIKANWKRKLMDQSFYRRPEKLNDSVLEIHKPLRDSSAKGIQPNQRRYTAKVPKGGLLVQVPYLNPVTGTKEKRKVQVKPYASTAAIFWRDVKGHLKISLERPIAIRKFIQSSIDPPIPKGIANIGRWERGEMIKLGAKDSYSAGFYRVKELNNNNIIVIPENNVTSEIAKKLGLPKEKAKKMERTLTKHELDDLFSQS
jgi:5-methylcytosine-specific restriction endonuclease McrA